MAPPRTASGTSAREAAAPTEKKQRSSSLADSARGVASSTSSSPAPNGRRVPAERAEANARTRSYPRSASNASVTPPTAPVAPMTPMRAWVLGMGPLRLGPVQLEARVQGPHRLLDLA